MSIIGIAAVAKNLAIGKDGKLPWHYSEDLKFFKRTTSGNTIVMGGNTWDAIGGPLPHRLNVVMTRSRIIEYQERLLVLRTTEDAKILSHYINGHMYIIGGAETYRSFSDLVEKWIVTDIPETIEDADAFMPADYLDGFRVVSTIEQDGGLIVKFYERTGDRKS